MNEKSIIEYFAGLSATIRSVKEVQKVYDPFVAFNFNAFNFLRPGENKYSELLAFFIDPSQTHGQGDTFLKIFLKNVGLHDSVSAHDFNSVKCKCEHGIENQRRIDILITFGNNKFAIAIENKIWAQDQVGQLKDYNSYLSSTFGDNYCLLYLSPFQKYPSEVSTVDIAAFHQLEKKGLFKLIGYTDNIIDCIHEWATNCRAERVRGFLTDFEQYLKKDFLGQTFMEENQTIANHALKSNENLEVAFATANALPEIKNKLLSILKDQLYEIAEINNLEIHRINDNLGLNENYTGFSFAFDSWKYAVIRFQFNSKNANDFLYGISLMGDENGNPVIMPPLLIKEVLAKFKRTKDKNDWWLFNDFFTGSYRNWSNQSKPWIDIQNGEMKKVIENIVMDYITVIGKLEF